MPKNSLWRRCAERLNRNVLLLGTCFACRLTKLLQMDFRWRRHCLSFFTQFQTVTKATNPGSRGLASKALLACCAVSAACTGRLLEPAGEDLTDPGGESTGGRPPGAGGGTTVTDGGGAAGMGGNVNPPPFEPAAGMLRRLTRPQFRNAVRDVFGVEVNIAELDADTWNEGFATIGASAVVTSERGVEQYNTAVEDAVNTLFADANRRAQFIGCSPSGQAGDPCVRGYIQKLGLRAWRRPLTSLELDRFVALASKAAADLGNAIEGTRWATVALFTSPSFLYRAELGTTTNGTLRYTGYEMASRLAFLLWNSLPDQALLDQAAAGTLTTPDGIRTAAARLLDAPAGREAVGAFADEYMRLDRIATQAKDPGLYPEYSAALQAGMARDMRGTWEAVVFDDGASVFDLFTTTKVVVNAELARLYGLDPTGLTSTTFQVRSLPANGPRAGILSKAGFLSQFANQKEGSPTLRGKFIREALTCRPVPPPPPDVSTTLPDPTADRPMTKRQRLEAHRTEPACANCHSRMDPLGLPLETFDAIGRYRTTDHGLPIDPSGDFDGTPVPDARGLGTAAAASATVAQCFVRKFYSYAVGHEERNVDGSVLNALSESFQASGYDLRELILDVVRHEAFSSVAPQP